MVWDLASISLSKDQANRSNPDSLCYIRSICCCRCSKFGHRTDYSMAWRRRPNALCYFLYYTCVLPAICFHRNSCSLKIVSNLHFRGRASRAYVANQSEEPCYEAMMGSSSSGVRSGSCRTWNRLVLGRVSYAIRALDYRWRMSEECVISRFLSSSCLRSTLKRPSASSWTLSRSRCIFSLQSCRYSCLWLASLSCEIWQWLSVWSPVYWPVKFCRDRCTGCQQWSSTVLFVASIFHSVRRNLAGRHTHETAGTSWNSCRWT